MVDAELVVIRLEIEQPARELGALSTDMYFGARRRTTSWFSVATTCLPPGCCPTPMVRSYGLRQEFITPHDPERNSVVERVTRTLRGECVRRHRFEALQQAIRVIGDWIDATTTGAPTRRLT